MILSCHEIRKAYADKEVLAGISFGMEEREITALIGINGAGKTTLLRILAGLETPDAGQVTVAKEKRIGYLAQRAGQISTDRSLLEEMRAARDHLYRAEEELRALEESMRASSGVELERLMERYTELTHSYESGGGYANESEITGVLKGLGFSETEFEKPLSTLSGGQQTRAALGALLLSSPDILLLDEPTNHLDLSSAAWLESYLLGCRKSVLVVSHDRYFLDRVATKIVEIERGRSITFPGNYSVYSEKKAALRYEQLRAWQKQQAEIRHQEDVIAKLRSYNREKSIRRAQTREKILDKMDRLERPREVRDEMRLSLAPRVVSGRDVLEVESLSKRFGDHLLFEGQSFSMQRGERMALVGANGTGKTTLLRILAGREAAGGGVFRLGTNVRIGYYDQELQNFHMEKTLFDEISDAYPTLKETEIRNMLAAFLFTGDDVFAPIHTLSGGERGRLSLAKLMLSGANFLLLDEPTNHLDITSREILEDALISYEGTVLYVSHDRYFINRTATRVLELSDGVFTAFSGNYDAYLEEKEKRGATFIPAADPEEVPSEARVDWLAAKQAAAQARKKENDLRRIEEEIEELETAIREIDEALTRPEIGTDAEECRRLAEERAGLSARLQELYQSWEAMA